MHCPKCNADGKRNPHLNMTTGFRVRNDNKTYLHCPMCGFNIVDESVEQPAEEVDPLEHLNLRESHMRLLEAHGVLQASHDSVAQDLAVTKAELSKAAAAIEALKTSSEPTDVKPGESTLVNPPAPPVAPTELPPAHSSV